MAERLEYVVSLRGGPEAASQVRGLEDAVGGAGGKMRQLGRESEKARPGLDRAAGGVRSVGKALLAAGGGFLAWEAGKKAFEFTHEMVVSTKQLHSAFHLGTAEASRWAGVVTAVGGNAGQASMAFQKLSSASEKQIESSKKLIAQHKAQSTALILGKAPLEKLGISSQYLEQHTKNLGPVMELVISRIHGMKNATAEGSVLTNLFGRGWKQLSPILLEGQDHFKHLMALAKEYGVEIGSTKGLEDFREQQIAANLATEGLRLSFTKLAAKPMAELLKGFSSLALAIKTGDWKTFESQTKRMGDVFSRLAENVMPHVAETFGHMAPIVLSAFWHGFQHASLGGEAIIGLVIAHKLGLTSSIFRAVGMSMMRSLGFGMAAESAAAGEAGTALGGFFGKAFIAAAVGAGIYSFLKNSSTEEPLSEAFHSIFGGHTALEEKQARSEADERKRFLGSSRAKHARKAYESLPTGARGEVTNLMEAQAKRELESYARKHPARKPFHFAGTEPHGHGAHGGTLSNAGMVEVGEYGPELLHLPQGAQIQPLAPGSWGAGDLVVNVDGRQLLRINKRLAMQQQAAGAG